MATNANALGLDNEYLSWTLADCPTLELLKALADSLAHGDSIGHGESSHNTGHSRTQVKDGDRAKGGKYRGKVPTLAQENDAALTAHSYSKVNPVLFQQNHETSSDQDCHGISP